MLGILIANLIPCILGSLCVKRDSCHYPDMNPLAAPFLDIKRQDIHPRSCAAQCNLTAGCVGVTFNPLDDMCHLYERNISFGITQDPNIILWLFQATGVPCVQVGWLAIRMFSLYIVVNPFKHIGVKTNGHHFTEDIFKYTFVGEKVKLNWNFSLRPQSTKC